MGLYLSNGFVNIAYCLKFNCPFTFIIGGRGTGKTFGAQKYCIENNLIYMLMRRTQAQTDLISKKEFSPVNPVMEYLHRIPIVESASKYNALILSKENEDDENSVLHGYTSALSTFANLRGFDGSAIKILLFDEFIPERHERALKNEADAFFNVYETINRNRELTGEKPLQTLLLSNSNSIASPIIAALNLVKTIERMQKKGQTEYINNDMGIAVFLLFNSPISNMKRNTALYRATKNTDFQRMAIENDFSYDDLSDVKSVSLNSGWKLIIKFGDMYIYNKSDMWYISKHGAGVAAKEYDFTEIGIRKFCHDFPKVYQRIINHKIIYEDFSLKNQLTSIYI